MAEKDLKNLAKEELIELVEKQEKELADARMWRDIYKKQIASAERKLQTIENIIEL